jgi:hypothetical protein
MTNVKLRNGNSVTLSGSPLVLDLNTSALKKIEAATGWDAMEVGAGKFDGFLKVVDDRTKLLQTVHAATGCDFDELKDLLRGEVFDAVTDALVEELASFFPSSKRRRFIAMWKAVQDLDEETMSENIKAFKETLAPVAVQQVREALKAATELPPPISGGLSTAPQPYSDSTPDLTLGVK